MMILLVIVVVVFLFGLFQWARSGAVFWDMHLLLKRGGGPSDPADLTEMDRRESARRKEVMDSTIQRMETSMDGFLRSSFKVLGVLALCVWMFVTFSLIVDALGLSWLDRLSFSANRVMGSPVVRGRTSSSSSFTTGGRGDTFRSMGAGFRR